MTENPTSLAPTDGASSGLSVPTGSTPGAARIERVARAISRAYIQGFRHAHPHITQWITTLDEAVELQWEMFCAEASDALRSNSEVSDAD